MKNLLLLAFVATAVSAHRNSMERRSRLHHKRVQAASCDKRDVTSVSSAIAFMGEQSGESACGLSLTDADYVVGLGVDAYGSCDEVSALCGKGVKVTNNANGKSITAVMGDCCDDCNQLVGAGSLYLSLGAFNAIDNYDTNANGYVTVEWSLTDGTPVSIGGTSTPAVVTSSAPASSPPPPPASTTPENEPTDTEIGGKTGQPVASNNESTTPDVGSTTPALINAGDCEEGSDPSFPSDAASSVAPAASAAPSSSAPAGRRRPGQNGGNGQGGNGRGRNNGGGNNGNSGNAGSPLPPAPAPPAGRPPRGSSPASPPPSSGSGSSSTGRSGGVAFQGVGKRGLGFNEPFGDTNNFKVAGAWGYNWFSQADGYKAGMSFIPTLWGNAPDKTGRWHDDASSEIAKGAKWLFSFNEPDLGSQANMSPQEAAGTYQAFMQPFAGQAGLVAPGVTNSGEQGQGIDSHSWVNQFLASCQGCTVDALNTHFYGGADQCNAAQDYLTKFHNAFPNYNFFVSELGFTGGSEDQIELCTHQLTGWMESQDFIAGYAIFGSIRPDKSDGFSSALMLDDNGQLTAFGRAYDS